MLQSRFAGLRIEDDDIPPPTEVKTKKKVNKEPPKKLKNPIKPQVSNNYVYIF